MPQINGTVTWFKISDGHKPKAMEGQDFSDRILILHDKKDIIGTGFYNLTIDRYFPHNGNWQPTHFAYINLPK